MWNIWTRSTYVSDTQTPHTVCTETYRCACFWWFSGSSRMSRMCVLAWSNWVSLYISNAFTWKCVWIAFLSRRNRSPLPTSVTRLPPERSSSAAIIGGRSASALPSFSIISVAAYRQERMAIKDCWYWKRLDVKFCLTSTPAITMATSLP